jgi:hypothetical protein
MIAKARNKRPIISYGFGITTKSVANGTAVKIWMNNLFLPSNYGSTIKPISGLSIVKVSANEYTITPSSTGTYSIQLEVTNTLTTKVKKSNKLTLTVT